MPEMERMDIIFREKTTQIRIITDPKTNSSELIDKETVR